ncbi:HD domain-containing protein 2-like, partial [Morus notabilis]
MGSVSRAWLCKSSSFVFLMPTLSSSTSHLRFKSVTAHTPSPNHHDHHSMATEASSSPSPLTSGDAITPPAPSSSSSSSSSVSGAIDFLSLCHRLKTTKRAGWVRRDVKDPESVADHMYRMGLMALIASDIPGVDRDRCMKMAIVHDIAE